MTIGPLKYKQEIKCGYYCKILLLSKMKNKLCLYFSFNTSLTLLDSKIENKHLKLPTIFFFYIITIQTLLKNRT